MGAQPKVSVLVITYNHADYIRQALDSVLMQQTAFAYEVLISEDCSTDGTRAIVTAYQQEHPAQIRLLLSPHNVRNNSVVARGIEAARGEYLALLDGDDYCTVAHKLQRQVDFMDRHPECSVCFHNAAVLDEDHTKTPWNWTPPDQKELSTLADLWMGSGLLPVPPFRRGIFGAVPDWYIDLFPITDWPLHLLNAEHGQVGYINEVMGVYRYHSHGFYSPLSEARKQETTLALYRTLNRNFAFQYDHLVKTGITKYFVEWAEEYHPWRVGAGAGLFLDCARRPADQPLCVAPASAAAVATTLQTAGTTAAKAVTPVRTLTTSLPPMSEPHPYRATIPPVAGDEPRPLWSVMIPTYHCARYLRTTLEHVLAQDLGPALMQIEVVDDYSTADDPEAVVAEVGQGRIGFFRQPHNVGHIANFTTCLQRSAGQLVHLLHGDDYVLPGFYNRLQSAFAQHPEAGAAFCRQIFMDEGHGHWQAFPPLEQQEKRPVGTKTRTTGPGAAGDDAVDCRAAQCLRAAGQF